MVFLEIPNVPKGTVFAKKVTYAIIKPSFTFNSVYVTVQHSNSQTVTHPCANLP